MHSNVVNLKKNVRKGPTLTPKMYISDHSTFQISKRHMMCRDYLLAELITQITIDVVQN